MISRSTLIAALVVLELAIVGIAARSLSIGASSAAPTTTTPLNRTFATGPSPEVLIDVRGVNTVVEAADTASVTVVETVHRAGFVAGELTPIVASQSGDVVRLIAPRGGMAVVIGIGDIEHHVKVTVPRAARVQIASAGRVEAAGLESPFSAQTHNGTILLHDMRGDIDVATHNGRIEMTNVRARNVGARSHNGRLDLQHVWADRIEAQSSNGRIDAGDMRVVDGVLSTGNGRITATFNPESDAAVTARSRHGAISVRDVASSDDGTSTRTLRLGSGRGHFEVSSGNGSITISQGANG